MNDQKRIEIAIAGDSNYIVPLTVLLQSVFVNNKDVDITVNFLYLTSAVREEDLIGMEAFIAEHGQKMRRLGVAEEQLGRIPDSRHSKSASLRLLLPEFLPETVSKILYLDGDIVVCGSLNPLWQTDISHSYVAAVKDPTILFGREYCAKIDIPEKAQYFNSGVLLMNIDRMRRDNVQEAFFVYMQKYINLLIAVDQDVLNATLYKAVTYLPPIYNYNYWLEKDVARQLFTKEEIKAVKHHPVIVHYIGPVKPWHCKSIHPKKALWWKYLKQTPYKDYRCRDNSLKNRLSYFLLLVFVKPFKPLLTVRNKQRFGRLLPKGIRNRVKRTLFKAQ